MNILAQAHFLIIFLANMGVDFGNTIDNEVIEPEVVNNQKDDILDIVNKNFEEQSEILDVSDHDLSKLPKITEQCTHITQLYADNNKLQELPNNLPNLKKLSVANNNLKSIPPYDSLEELDCRNNPDLDNLPPLPSLLILKAEGTKIESVNQNDYKKLIESDIPVKNNNQAIKKGLDIVSRIMNNIKKHDHKMLVKDVLTKWCLKHISRQENKSRIVKWCYLHNVNISAIKMYLTYNAYPNYPVLNPMIYQICNEIHERNQMHVKNVLNQWIGRHLLHVWCKKHFETIIEEKGMQAYLLLDKFCVNHVKKTEFKAVYDFCDQHIKNIIQRRNQSKKDLIQQCVQNLERIHKDIYSILEDKLQEEHQEEHQEKGLQEDVHEESRIGCVDCNEDITHNFENHTCPPLEDECSCDANYLPGGNNLSDEHECPLHLEPGVSTEIKSEPGYGTEHKIELVKLRENSVSVVIDSLNEELNKVKEELNNYLSGVSKTLKVIKAYVESVPIDFANGDEVSRKETFVELNERLIQIHGPNTYTLQERIQAPDSNIIRVTYCLSW